jgi:hypothetical protein
MITPEEELDIKMKFYAQYFGQKIVRSEFVEQARNLTTVNANCFAFPHLIINSCLKLKSIENITDEDKNIIEQSIIGFVDKLFFVGCFGYIDCKSAISENIITTFLNSYHFDFLRSKGYAVPFMEYSIDDLIKMNFIKITQ